MYGFATSAARHMLHKKENIRLSGDPESLRVFGLKFAIELQLKSCIVAINIVCKVLITFEQNSSQMPALSHILHTHQCHT